MVQEEEIKEDEAEILKRLLKSTMDYLVMHDKKEMLDLLIDFIDEVYEEFINVVHKFAELIDVFLDTNDRRAERKARITKSKQHRLKMLLNDINSNRYRVQTIFHTVK